MVSSPFSVTNDMPPRGESKLITCDGTGKCRHVFKVGVGWPADCLRGQWVQLISYLSVVGPRYGRWRFRGILDDTGQVDRGSLVNK